MAESIPTHLDQTCQVRPPEEVRQRLSVAFGPHFAEFFVNHFNGFGRELIDIALCNRVALLLADYAESLPAVSRAPWDMLLEAGQGKLMSFIVADPDAGRAQAIWGLVTKEES